MESSNGNLAPDGDTSDAGIQCRVSGARSRSTPQAPGAQGCTTTALAVLDCAIRHAPTNTVINKTLLEINVLTKDAGIAGILPVLCPTLALDPDTGCGSAVSCVEFARFCALERA